MSKTKQLEIELIEQIGERRRAEICVCGRIECLQRLPLDI